MKLPAARVLLFLPIHLALAAVAQAGTLSGTVVNRTTGKPAPGRSY